MRFISIPALVSFLAATLKHSRIKSLKAVVPLHYLFGWPWDWILEPLSIPLEELKGQKRHPFSTRLKPWVREDVPERDFSVRAVLSEGRPEGGYRLLKGSEWVRLLPEGDSLSPGFK